MVCTHDIGRTCERRERRDSIENRGQILAAARRLFAARGVDNTSMHEIGIEAGVGQGTLYRNYAHKGELCRALLEDDLAAHLSRIVSTLDRADTPEPALDRLGWLLDELIQMTDSHVPLLAAMHEAAVGPRRREAFGTPFYVSIYERITGLIQSAIDRGEAQNVDAELTAAAILAAINPHLFVFQREQRGFSTERIARGIRSLFVDGLRRRHPTC
ncbi:MAG TPA: TetR/AcrR family transcriptional regulator [Chloroflexota bacterium]|nr:TetR/AcrR family transcriptional regulator [Chloroflexota bacterium]